MITKIVNLMTVPLIQVNLPKMDFCDCRFYIQGTLRYAYKTAGGKGGPKEKAEGIAFLGAFLPRLHNCSAEVEWRKLGVSHDESFRTLTVLED